MQSQAVSVGQPVRAGQLIGAMGGIGAKDVQHVHYQMFDPSGRRINPAAFWDDQQPASPYKPAVEVPSLEDFRALQALTESGPATFNERWSFSKPRGATPAIGDNNGIGDWWRNTGEDPKKMNLTANEPSQPLNTAARKVGGDVTTGTLQASGLRLEPPQQQGAPDSSAFMRSLVDQAAASGATPAPPPEDTSELFKLRSIIQAMGSRGLFPIQ